MDHHKENVQQIKVGQEHCPLVTVSSLRYQHSNVSWLLGDFLVINCGDPGIPDNGTTMGNSTTFGSVVTHTCDPGFVLNGEDERECVLSDDPSIGVWSEPLPTCDGKSTILN